MIRRVLATMMVVVTAAVVSAQAPTVIDDFESGSLKGWSVENRGVGSWYVYTNGKTPPNPGHSDPIVPFSVPNPPQGKFGAVTDMDGPGTRFLSRTLTLNGRYRLRMSVYYSNGGPRGFVSANTLAVDGEPNQQFRIDIMSASAAIDSLAPADIKANVFHTSPGDPAERAPSDVTADLSSLNGQTVKLRLVTADNSGPLRAGVDNIRLEPIGK